MREPLITAAKKDNKAGAVLSLKHLKNVFPGGIAAARQVSIVEYHCGLLQGKRLLFLSQNLGWRKDTDPDLRKQREKILEASGVWPAEHVDAL